MTAPATYAYRYEVYELDVDGYPVLETLTTPDGIHAAHAAAKRLLDDGASSAIIQLVTTWRKL